MSNFDQIWNEAQAKAARAEGWELAFVVNDGAAIQTAYLEIFDVGPKFPNRGAAAKFVISKAQERSRLHVDALSACSATRMTAATSQAQRPRRKR